MTSTSSLLPDKLPSASKGLLVLLIDRLHPNVIWGIMRAILFQHSKARKKGVQVGRPTVATLVALFFISMIFLLRQISPRLVWLLDQSFEFTHQERNETPGTTSQHLHAA